MRYQEGDTGGGARPGSRTSRLSDANKQLSILLEDVDIDDEPALAEALIDAVRAVGRAEGLVAGADERGRWEAVDRSSRGRREWEDVGERPNVGELNDRSRSTIESGRSEFVPEAGVK